MDVLRTILMLLLASLLAAGCTQVLSKQARNAVTPGVDFTQIKRDPLAYPGAVLLLGGKIVETRPAKDVTTLEVLKYHLGAWDRPSDPDEAGGRFLARSERYLDPALYEKGRLVTLVGELEGTETRRLGEIGYLYPVFRVRDLYLWPLLNRPSPYDDPFYPSGRFHFHNHMFFHH